MGKAVGTFTNKWEFLGWNIQSNMRSTVDRYVSTSKVDNISVMKDMILNDIIFTVRETVKLYFNGTSTECYPFSFNY